MAWSEFSKVHFLTTAHYIFGYYMDGEIGYTVGKKKSKAFFRGDLPSLVHRRPRNGLICNVQWSKNELMKNLTVQFQLARKIVLLFSLPTGNPKRHQVGVNLGQGGQAL